MEGLFIVILALLALSLVPTLIKKLLPGLRGKYGEELVRRELEKHLPSFRYQVLHDITLPAAAGTTQIDHIALSSHGLFVIETKNFSGWIFGSEFQSQWTQTFRNKKFQFQNPLRQNYHHVKVLQELLGLKAGAIFPVVVFAGNAQFKSPMPENVIRLKELAPFILSKVDEVISPKELQRLFNLIETRRLAQGVETDAAHVQSLKQRYGQATSVLDGIAGLIGGTQTTLKFARAAIGVALIAVLLAAGTFVVRNVVTILRPAPVASQPVTSPMRPQLRETVQNPAVTTSTQPSFGEQLYKTLLPQTNAMVEKSKADALTRKREVERQKHLAWEASLMCAYSEDTHRCACYDPKGPKVNIEHELCVKLAEKGSVLKR